MLRGWILGMYRGWVIDGVMRLGSLVFFFFLIFANGEVGRGYPGYESLAG